MYLIFETNSGILFLIFISGKVSPIVPVQPKIISLVFIFLGVSSSSFCFSDNFSETVSAILSKLLYPCLPVKQLAFLAFTISENTFLLMIAWNRNYV